MKHILVLGNGFDIAHEYDTKYENFYDFCMVLKRFNNRYIDESLRKDIADTMIKKNFKKSAANAVMYVTDLILLRMMDVCKKNYWLELMKRKKTQDDNDWCNIEKLIENEIILIDNVILKIGSSNYQYTREISLQQDEISRVNHLIKAYALNNNTLKGVKEFKNKIKDDLDKVTWLLNCYLSMFLNKKKKQYPFFISLPVNYIINFNYTDNYRLLYNKLDVPIHFIHGKATREEKKLNLVFGIGDSIKNLDNDYDYIEFQKYYQRIIKKTGNDYVRWLNSVNSVEAINVYIFGHSVNVVDGDIIKRLILREHTHIFIFYYDQDSLNSIVLNLVIILGKEKLIEYTNKEKIVFVKNDLESSFGVNSDVSKQENQVYIPSF